MNNNKTLRKKEYRGTAPKLKDFLLVLLVWLLLMALSWLAYYKWNILT